MECYSSINIQKKLLYDNNILNQKEKVGIQFKFHIKSQKNEDALQN